MSAKSIVKALGGRWMGGYGMIPCPIHDDREPSCKITDDPRKSDGVDVVCFAGCGWQEIKAALHNRGLLGKFEHPMTPDRAVRHCAPPEPDPDPKAVAMWRDAVAIDGTLAEQYLRDHRGLTGPFPSSLRFTHSASYPPAGIHLPALVAAVSRKDRKLIAIQVTFLRKDGQKAQITTPRMTFGRLGTGAIRLAAAGELLGFAEGTETALAAMQLTGVPTWASLGAKRLARIAIPDGVRTLHVFGDNDEPGVKAASAAADHYSKTGLRVLLRHPPGEFNDYADFSLALQKVGVE